MKEYKVGEIFELNGEIFQCVEDPRDFNCEDCMLCVDGFPCSESSREDGKNVHFVKVTEITEGMLFRADNGKLYRFTTDLKDGEKCDCGRTDHPCEGIIWRLRSIDPHLQDRLPAKWWFIPVNESEEPDGHSESEATPSRRHIEIAVDAVKGGKVTFRIMEQTHRCDDFTTKGPGFKSRSGYLLISKSCPVADACTDGLFVRGWLRLKDDTKVTVNLETFARIMEAVTEYNLTNGTGYEKPWPQYGDKYFCINSTGFISYTNYDNYQIDNDRREFGNFFRTCEEAEAALERVKKALRGK